MRFIRLRVVKNEGVKALCFDFMHSINKSEFKMRECTQALMKRLK